MGDEERVLCGLCGEPMPPGEEMFNYHGYSGPCPKQAGEATPPATPAEPPDQHKQLHRAVMRYLTELNADVPWSDVVAARGHLVTVACNYVTAHPPDVERLTREAFRAGFLAVCRKKSDDTPLDMLTRVWTFDGVAAADLESEAYAAWRALSPSTPGEPT